MKNFCLFLILLFTITRQLYSQSLFENASNEMKYWKLRGRLTGDENNRDVYNGFMRVGLAQGMGIPAEQRYPSYLRDYYFFNPGLADIQQCEIQGIYTGYNNLGQVTGTPIIDPRDGHDLVGIQYFGDNPLISIGTYLGVLATEYELIKRDGGNTDQTLMEMYYALKGIERIDEHSENSLYGGANSLNGFLMRDDVYKEFELNNPGRNIDMVQSRFSCTSNDIDVNTKSESEANGCEVAGPYGYAKKVRMGAMSQDEVVGLLVGFSIIRKLIPNNVFYNGVNIRNLTATICERIIKYVKKGTGNNFWIIVDPVTNRPVCRGPGAIFFSYPMAVIGDYVCNNTPAQTLQNNHSLVLGNLVWHHLKQLYSLNLNINPFQNSTTLALNIAGEIYSIVLAKLDHDGNYNISLFLDLVTSSRTGYLPFTFDFLGKQLINSVASNSQKQIYDLQGAVMNGYKPATTKTWWKDEFNQLNCGCNCIQGIDPLSYKGCNNYWSYNGGGYVIPPTQWSVQNRWGKRGRYGMNNSVHEEFPGLDYMLAYNLFRCSKLHDGSTGYSPKIRKQVSNAEFPFWIMLPGNWVQLGSNQNHLEVKSVFSVEASNTILNNDAELYFFAGSDIKLKPGFHAKLGSVFKADIREYDCTPNQFFIGNQEFMNFKTEDTLTQNTFLDYTDTTGFEAPEDDTTGMYHPHELDTTIYSVSIFNDTIMFTLNPNYIIDDSGNYIYAPANNKTALDEVSINNITLFPNPSNTTATLSYMLYYDNEVKILITNELGQEMRNVAAQELYHQKKGKQNILLNTANLSAGVYFCIVELNGRRQVLKFSVLK